MYYFYCPKCQYEEEVENKPRRTIGNCRDGWGAPIYHYACPKCGNVDAGYMGERSGDELEKSYYKHIIGMYKGFVSGVVD